MNPSASRKFECLEPEALINTSEFGEIERFLRETGRTQIGWHYITDLVWIYRRARAWPKAAQVLDAGGGSGPTQFLLAEMGFHVTNVDLKLPTPTRLQQQRYRAVYDRLPSYQTSSYVEHLHAVYGHSGKWKQLLRAIKSYSPFSIAQVANRRRKLARWRNSVNHAFHAQIGTLRFVEGNLCYMPELPEQHFDAVVSLSALEHIPREDLKGAVAEICRVLKPDARWAVTTSATHLADSWFHAPSCGWCFSKDDLALLFNAHANGTQDLQAVLEQYRQCTYLKAHLASFYKTSGQNGMPWGKWDPQYVPVGIF